MSDEAMVDLIIIVWERKEVGRVSGVQNKEREKNKGKGAGLPSIQIVVAGRAEEIKLCAQDG